MAITTLVFETRSKHLYQSLQYYANVLVSVYKKRGPYSMNGIISYIVVILFSKRSKWDDIQITELTHQVRLRVMLWLNDIEENFFCNQRCRPLLTTRNNAGWRYFSIDFIFKNQKLHPLLFNVYCWHYLGLHLKALASYSSHAGVLYLYFLFAQFCTCFT